MNAGRRKAPPSAAPPPEPPEPPEPGDCCNSGCERCVYTVYEEALEKYREALRVWEQDRRDEPEQG